jgi:hypothetical protein
MTHSKGSRHCPHRLYPILEILWCAVSWITTGRAGRVPRPLGHSTSTTGIRRDSDRCHGQIGAAGHAQRCASAWSLLALHHVSTPACCEL